MPAFNLPAFNTNELTLNIANKGDNKILSINAQGLVDAIPIPTSSGVTSITGTANQVNSSASTGAVTLSLPQSIATTSTPMFGRIMIGPSDMPTNKVFYVEGDQSGGLGYISRKNGTNNAVVSTFGVKAQSTANTTDGYGPRFNFAIQDPSNAEKILAYIAAYRYNNDFNNGQLKFGSFNGNTEFTLGTWDALSGLQINNGGLTINNNLFKLGGVTNTPAVGAILTSDANGVGTWQTPKTAAQAIRGVTAPTTLLQTDEIIAVDFANPGALTLPDVSTRIVNGATKQLIIKKRTNTATITVTAQSGQTIDGQPSIALLDDLKPSLTIVADPIVTTNWMIIN